MSNAIVPFLSSVPADPQHPASELAALVDATVVAIALVDLTTQALRRHLEKGVGRAPSSVSSLPAIAAPLPLISEDEFGAWSRTLIERRVDGRAKGAR